MGEATKEEAQAVAKPEDKVEKKEEKQEEKKEEKSEEKKEEAEPTPPPPIVLFVDMHCIGCAKKIERSILKCKGVEGVAVDMAQNQVTVKGLVDPQALCTRIQKKTFRKARVISPLPPAEGDSAKSQVIPSQVSAITTIELHVNMHCDACAQQLRRKILKMRGVQTAEADLSTGKVIVSGTMDGDKLVQYIYRRTGKLARIIPPPPKEEEKKDEGEKKAEEKPPEEKKEQKAEEEKKEEKVEKKEEDNGNKDGDGKEGKEGGEEQKKEGEGPAAQNVHIVTEEDMVKRMMYWNGWNGWNGSFINEDEMARRRMVNWMPVYVIERPPPAPQLFSDENPNACCIT